MTAQRAADDDPTAGAGMVVVPHTHWDREWYEPHEVFRLRLVHTMDAVLATAEADQDFRFTLDGQAAAIDDYLQIRPEHRDRVVRLNRQGRLALGPWHILLDEFCCSGETIVRNLELGWATAEALGGAMPVGHLPDMFGHVAQMPQILAGFGIRHASLWRGVPAAVRSHAFRWVAPDGSAVRVEHLFDGYGNGLNVFALPGDLSRHLAEYRDRTASWWGHDPVLAMLGSDHTAPAADAMDRIRAHNAGAQRDATGGSIMVAVGTLWDYLRRFHDQDGLTEVTGELRSHARGNLLPGVFSVRTNLKAAMSLAERLLTEAERADALWGTEDNAAFLRLGWRRVVESTAHDSITGCGVDATADQVAARLASAAHLGRAVLDRVFTAVAADVPADAVLVTNPLPWPRTVQVEVQVQAPAGGAVRAVGTDGAELGVQVVGELPTELGGELLASAELERVLRRVHGRELFGQLVDTYAWAEDSLDLLVAEVPQAEVFDLAALRTEVEAAAARPGPWRVTTTARPRLRVVVQAPVPALGHAAVRLVPGDDIAAGAAGAAVDDGPTAGAAGQGAAGRAGVTAGDRWLANDAVRVRVAPDGTLDVLAADGTALRGVGRLVDVGDRGDSYNFGPMAGDAGIDRPASVRVVVAHRGPLRGVLEVHRGYRVPLGMGGDPDCRHEETAVMDTVTRVELRDGEPFVRLTVSVVNPAGDHRLRLHVPLPHAVDHSVAEGQFAVTRRGLTGEGGWGEFPLPTYPATGFVAAGPVTVLLDKLTEYELVDGGAELAITLLRAVGLMSVNVHPLRDEPAGSQLPVPGAQELGVEVVTRLAVLPSPGGWQAAQAQRWSQVFRHQAGAYRGTAPAGGRLPAPGAGAELTGPGVLTSLRRRDGHLEARVLAATEEPGTIGLHGLGDLVETDLRGRDLAAVTGEELAVRPWQIRTVRTAR